MRMRDSIERPAAMAGWPGQGRAVAILRRRRVAPLAVLFVAAAWLAAGTARACEATGTEHTVMHDLTVAAVGRAGVPAAPALLNTPPGWQRGCPAVIVTWEGDEPAPARSNLIAGLLERGLAVLELDISTPYGLAADNAVVAVPQGGVPPADYILGAALALHAKGAGAVVALGFGRGGAAAVGAAGDQPGGPAPALAAAGQLGPGGDFVHAGTVAGGQEWLPWAARICRAVNEAVRGPNACSARWAMDIARSR